MSEDGLSADEAAVADPKSGDTYVGGPTSTALKIAGLTVYLAGDVTVSVAPSADLAGDVMSMWHPQPTLLKSSP